MAVFDLDARTRTPRSKRLWAAYELAYTMIDFAAAALFVVGSILFFDEATVRLGTWLFLIGSLCFAAKPSIRMVREVHLWRAGQIDVLAERAGD